MQSQFVRNEWEHALSLGRANFIRPTYWEDPLPESPNLGLPPQTLRELHFHRLPVGPREFASGPSGGQQPQDIVLDTEFEVHTSGSHKESDDNYIQLDDGRDLDLEVGDSGSGVFAIDEEAVDQNAATTMAPSADDEEDDEDYGFGPAVSSETAASWSYSEDAASPERAPDTLLARDTEDRAGNNCRLSRRESPPFAERKATLPGTYSRPRPESEEFSRFQIIVLVAVFSTLAILFLLYCYFSGSGN